MNNLPPGTTDKMIEDQQDWLITEYTEQDVKRLKVNWLNDPCWDIEDTEGFENYYIELKAFRIGYELDYEQHQELQNYSKSLQLNCSLELAEYILKLEKKISRLENFMAKSNH